MRNEIGIASLEYITSPIEVLLVRSHIYAEELMDNSWANTEENLSSYILNLPIYKNYGIPLNDLMKELSKASSLNFSGCQILYKFSESPDYVLAGIYPFTKSSECVQIKSLTDTIQIKHRMVIESKKVGMLKEEKKVKIRRGNERGIGEVVDALSRWKQLYTEGKIGKDGIREKYSRHDAAKVLKMPKKTLDDYAAQVKLAKSNNFDFQLHCKEKFGILRKFNRQKSISRHGNANCSGGNNHK
eukprot:TRINITY_DN6469_c0_g3_i1.p1 TRINITY_DN6469_c0_g3~~TRINITY_DN6469_c0_g3_i1.p1  ORF type:complete len:243 (-),score=51.09 TRINITY_DN6469_c0_g3_i1:497-1225(-)